MQQFNQISDTGIDYSAVYVYAQESSDRDALQCSLGTIYTVEDYNDDWTSTEYQRFSTADAWVTNNTKQTKTIWELKNRPDIHIYTYNDGYFNAGKAAKLAQIQKKHPEFPIYVGLIYPMDKSVVVYPLEEVQKFPKKQVRAWSPDQGKYVWETNHLVPVSDIDRVHNAGGYIRHWSGCDWDEMYNYNERIGIELSERGLLE